MFYQGLESHLFVCLILQDSTCLEIYRLSLLKAVLHKIPREIRVLSEAILELRIL